MLAKFEYLNKFDFHRIRGTGIFTYITGCFFKVNVGKYTVPPMDPMGICQVLKLIELNLLLSSSMLYLFMVVCFKVIVVYSMLVSFKPHYEHVCVCGSSKAAFRLVLAFLIKPLTEGRPETCKFGSTCRGAGSSRKGSIQKLVVNDGMNL